MRYLHSKGLISSGVNLPPLAIANTLDLDETPMNMNQVIMAAAISMEAANCISLTGKFPSKKYLSKRLATSIVDCFFHIGSTEPIGSLVAADYKTCSISIRDEHTEILSFEFSRSAKNAVKITVLNEKQLPNFKVLYLPRFDFISTFNGFQGALENRELHFNKLYLQVLKSLSGIPLKNFPPEITKFEDFYFPGKLKFTGREFFYEKNKKVTNPAIASYLINTLATYMWLIKNGSINKNVAFLAHDLYFMTSAKITIQQILSSLHDY
jgi:hypothetical protein